MILPSCLAATAFLLGLILRSVNAAACSAVNSACSGQANSAVTAYCSSYISVGVKTVTSPKKTVTNTFTQTIYTAYVTTTISATSCPTTGAAKRDMETVVRRQVAKPSCLSKFKSSVGISSACSCITIPSSTTTVLSGKATATTAVTVSRVKTQTKRLLPAPSGCATIAYNSSISLNNDYVGCSFSRQNDDCAEIETFNTSLPICTILKKCIGLVVNPNDTPHQTYPNNTAVELYVDLQGSSAYCLACLPTVNGVDDFDLAGTLPAMIYGYQ